MIVVSVHKKRSGSWGGRSGVGKYNQAASGMKRAMVIIGKQTVHIDVPR